MTELMTVWLMSSVYNLKYESIYRTAVQLGESTHVCVKLAITVTDVIMIING